MGLLDCVASPDKDEFDERERPISRPRQISRSDHDISKRRGIPLFASQSSLKTVRDADFYREKMLRFLYSPEGRDDVRVLKIPFSQIGFSSITDFVSSIPEELFLEYHNQTPPDDGIFKDDKVFWIRDGIAEPGTFKWQGVIDNEPCVGVQLDRKKAVPFGIHDGKGLFYCKPGHRALVPEDEVTPYKKFLRGFLGVPVRKDSYQIVGSIRLSAKAIAAKNSKPGDRVYLPKEKKYAIVQWIGRIGGETVVDLVYEPPKPEAGKPVSPDEPCVSRSLSMGDFIDEVGASEPNTPVAVQPQPQENVLQKLQKQPSPSPQHVAPPPPPPPPATATSSDESEKSELSASDDDDEENDDDDDDDSESEEEEDDDSDSQEESEKSETDDSEDERDSIPSPKAPVPPPPPPPVVEVPVIKQQEQEIKDDSRFVFDDSTELSPRLPSPQRKGFFKFTPNKKPQKSPPTPLWKDDDAEELILHANLEKQTTPAKRSKSPNFFSNFKFKTTNKKRKEKEPVPIEAKPVPPAPLAPVQKKKQSEWGRLFKSRSKNRLEATAFEDSRSPIECTTPIDEMIPPEKIPTPPPAPSQLEEFSERRIERPEFLEMPSSPTEKQDQNRIQVTPGTKSPVVERFRADIVLSPRDESSGESESSDTDEEEDDVPSQQIATKVELHETPTESEDSDSSFESDSDSSEEHVHEIGVQEPALVTHEAKSPVKAPENLEPKFTTSPVKDEPSPITSPKASIDLIKDSQVRNRPLSFGSFLARIKNQSKKPPGSPPEPPEHDTKIDANPDESRKVTGSPKLKNQVDPTVKGYKTLSESESSLSSTDVKNRKNSTGGSSGAGIEINKTLVKPPKMVTEGNQEGIMLDLLDVKEQGIAVNSPPPATSEESPKRKNSKSRSSFTFTFSKKRKSSHPQTPTPLDTNPTSTEPRNSEEELRIENREHVESSHHEQSPPAKAHEDKDMDKKQSLTSSFRNSFRRTFSLTKKRAPSTADSDGENVKSPTGTINKPRPVTMFFDNDEVVKKRDSFRSKRPASVVVDIQPWNARHGRKRGSMYSTSSDDGPSTKSPNPALLPKEPETREVPKHRMFTTPSMFLKKSKKPNEESVPPQPQASKDSYSNYKKFNFLGSGSQPQTPKTPTSAQSTPQNEQPPPLPTAPPPLPTTSPRASVLKTTPSFTEPDSTSSPTSQSLKLKSALKQRKEIDSIPQGLKVNDRVLWYSGKTPVPGTVQRLFKDGTDKYTAMVKFDREVSDEPLCLTREGDAYIITVEELITPDMFEPDYSNQQQSPAVSTSPQTPTNPSVRFDGVSAAQEQEVPQVTVTAVTEPFEEHDLPPPFQEEEVQVSCGLKRGLQCQDRSCCLETILFSLFYTTNMFDIAMLYPNTSNEDALSRNARIILRREIVDPLRRHGFCPSSSVKKLRDAVKPLSNEWQTLSTDAEVMMFILFDRALKLGKFISYSNGMSDFLHQLVVDTKDLSKSTTVQHLFETSLHLMDRLKLTTAPTPALILEMPRSKDKLVQYNAVIPNLTLHVSHLLDDGNHRLCICNVVAQYECRHCAANFGDQSIVYCDQCKGSADIIHFQLTHEADLLPLSQTLVVLDLVALICVKAGHYFSFVKCGNKKLSPWVFFDGGESDSPKVCIEENLGMWLERLEKFPGKYHDALQYPLLTHILQDGHICIYQPRERSSSV